MNRPWDGFEEGPFEEQRSWAKWLAQRWESGGLGHKPFILDELDTDQRAFLFVTMCVLADSNDGDTFGE